MQKREKCDIRYIFTPDEKAQMLKRSGGVCVHCGKKLKLNSKDLTAEHIIPLSKGGKNNKDNLVALCKACNHDKGNDVVWSGWYKYANEELRTSIARMYKRYFRDYDHLDNNHYTRCDRYGFYIDIDAKTGDIVDKNVPWKPIVVQKGVEIRRATCGDLEKICQAYKKFNKIHNLNHDDKFVRKTLSTVMRHGCVWYSENNNGIQFVVPMLIMQCEFEGSMKKALFNSKKANVKQCELTAMYIISLSRRNIYYNAMMSFILQVAHDLAESLGVRNLPVSIDGYDDGLLGSFLSHYFESYTPYGDMLRSRMVFCDYEPEEVDDTGIKGRAKELSNENYIDMLRDVSLKLKEAGITPITPKQFVDEVKE